MREEPALGGPDRTRFLAAIWAALFGLGEKVRRALMGDRLFLAVS
jgi:hypothetical protein